MLMMERYNIYSFVKMFKNIVLGFFFRFFFLTFYPFILYFLCSIRVMNADKMHDNKLTLSMILLNKLKNVK